MGARPRIYGAGGSNGGLIRRGGDGGSSPVKMAASDFRFDPADERFELISGGARFGNTFDDWGRRFLCNIRNPIRHAVIEDRYLARNPLHPGRLAALRRRRGGRHLADLPHQPARALARDQRTAAGRRSARSPRRGARRWPRAM